MHTTCLIQANFNLIIDKVWSSMILEMHSIVLMIIIMLVSFTKISIPDSAHFSGIQALGIEWPSIDEHVIAFRENIMSSRHDGLLPGY